MKASHVEIIVAIADAGSQRAAAGRVGKTQPALTKALRQAEGELGWNPMRVYSCEGKPFSDDNCVDTGNETVADPVLTPLLGYEVSRGDVLKTRVIHVDFGDVGMLFLPGEVSSELVIGLPEDFNTAPPEKYNSNPDEHATGAEPCHNAQRRADQGAHQSRHGQPGHGGDQAAAFGRALKDSRIHFALHRAMRSSPPLRDRAYEPHTLESDLDAVTQSFLASQYGAQIRERQVFVNDLFESSASDWGGEEGIKNFLRLHAPARVKEFLDAPLGYLVADTSLAALQR